MLIRNGSTALACLDMTAAEIEAAKHWPVETGFKCEVCDNAPSAEPQGSRWWACLHCKRKTINPSTLFVPATKVA